jgi:hypothetical protein
MSPLIAERPPCRVRKLFDRKVLRHFYVPFVSSDRRAQEVRKANRWVAQLQK